MILFLMVQVALASQQNDGSQLEQLLSEAVESVDKETAEVSSGWKYRLSH